jgi:omega-6 fatty acid desaturase (delta-12 desaturase)
LEAQQTGDHVASPSDKTQAQREFLQLVAPYRRAQVSKSVWQLTSTLVLFAGGWLLMLWSLQWNFTGAYFLTLLAAVPTALLLVRLFIIQHDCGHRSFFSSRRANDAVGVLLGMLTYTPYHCWRKQHATHHATSGDLDRRGRGGEIRVLTVREYREAGLWQRIGYRLYRNPLVLFVIAPLYYFVMEQRFTFGLPKTWKKERASVHYTNLGVLAITALLIWLVGWQAFLLVQLPIMLIGSSAGVWLFYVQHQYEETYWRHHSDWSYVDAALYGSSYYRLPKVLQWFTANIGLHHIHHLDSRIPNYRLQNCLDEVPELNCARTITLWESFSCAMYKLWDEEQCQMVGFPRS